VARHGKLKGARADVPRRSELPARPVPPIRTCVGCRVRGAKPELIRLVVAGGEIVPDITARLPGRGAYLHRSLACLERAQRRKAFSRALRLPEGLPAKQVAEYLAAVAGCPDRRR
jgi:uncharacterized protein